jgi:hypothetical protein
MKRRGVSDSTKRSMKRKERWGGKVRGMRRRRKNRLSIGARRAI